jgi:hypothetical protein
LLGMIKRRNRDINPLGCAFPFEKHGRPAAGSKAPQPSRVRNAAHASTDDFQRAPLDRAPRYERSPVGVAAIKAVTILDAGGRFMQAVAEGPTKTAAFEWWVHVA